MVCDDDDDDDVLWTVSRHYFRLDMLQSVALVAGELRAFIGLHYTSINIIAISELDRRVLVTAPGR
jgi:hypothetical protein